MERAAEEAGRRRSQTAGAIIADYDYINNITDGLLTEKFQRGEIMTIVYSNLRGHDLNRYVHTTYYIVVTYLMYVGTDFFSSITYMYRLGTVDTVWLIEIGNAF